MKYFWTCITAVLMMTFENGNSSWVDPLCCADGTFQPETYSPCEQADMEWCTEGNGPVGGGTSVYSCTDINSAECTTAFTNAKAACSLPDCIGIQRGATNGNKFYFNLCPKDSSIQPAGWPFIQCVYRLEAAPPTDEPSTSPSTTPSLVPSLQPSFLPSDLWLYLLFLQVRVQVIHQV